MAEKVPLCICNMYFLIIPLLINTWVGSTTLLGRALRKAQMVKYFSAVLTWSPLV